MNASVVNKLQPIKEREMLYRLIVSQLRYDGYVSAAQAVSHIISSYPPTSPSSRLHHLVQLGQRMEGEVAAGNDADMADVFVHLRGQGIMDLEFEGDENPISPEAFKHEVTYITSHKGPSLIAAFSNDGRLAATGSGDNSIKLLDVDKMMSKTALGHQDNHPVIRTLYDHQDAVLALDFHPTFSVMASGSNDCTVKFFDYSKPSVKRSYRTIHEVASIKTIMFHPSGEFVLVGTEQPTIRLYDVNTLQCFVSSDSRDQHMQPITSVHYSSDGRMYVSASKDGSIKLWDGVSNRCINTFIDAHDKCSVSTVQFSKNAKYVLSSGRDGRARLWELSTDWLKRCQGEHSLASGVLESRVMNLSGPQKWEKEALSQAGRTLNTYNPTRVQRLDYGPCATFNHTEDYVLMGEDKGGHQLVLCWDSRSTQAQTPLTTGHSGTLQYITHSPTAPAFITCSTDNKIRFFYRKDT